MTKIRFSWLLIVPVIALLHGKSAFAEASPWLQDLSSSGLTLVLLFLTVFLLTSLLTVVAVLLSRRRKLQKHVQLYGASLPGLPNRLLFLDRLNRAIALAKRHVRQCALLCIELDDCKQISTDMGAANAEDLLKMAAERIGACCRSSDTLAYLEGNGFALLLAEVGGLQGVQNCVEKIVALMQEPFDLPKGPVRIGVSVGIAFYPDNGSSAEALLNSAAQAMRLVQSQGGGSYLFAG